jgi:hypothetical protein
MCTTDVLPHGGGPRRLSTTGLLLVVSLVYPRLHVVAVALIFLDIFSHWFQMYSTLAAGAVTHKVCPAAFQARVCEQDWRAARQRLLWAPVCWAAGHTQPQLAGARVLLQPPVHGLLLRLVRGAVPRGTSRGGERLEAAECRDATGCARPPARAPHLGTAPSSRAPYVRPCPASAPCMCP